MNRNDFSKILIGVSNFLSEPFHSEIYDINIHNDMVNILMNNSDYSKEELFDLINKHLSFLNIGFKQYNKITEQDEETKEEIYLHHQLIFFFRDKK